jgi:hypothetical protein
VRFRLGAYDRSRPLVIDPKVVYASYWGGTGNEGSSPAVDPAGNMYLTCGTDSPNLPTVNAIQPHQGGEDVCILKLDRSGTRIVYSTYLGSIGDDEGDSIAVSPRGEAYVSGFASGQDFPTTPGAYDTSFNGGSLPGCVCFGDVFVSKLSVDGSRLLYSTFVGGSESDRTSTLALDHDGSVALIGNTGSSDFPTTPGAVQSTFGGGTATFEDVPTDAFAAKLDPSGSRLLYSTYLGGSGDDAGNSVAVDDAGNAYYTGFTQSPEFPTTPGALKTSFGTPSPLLNAYVTKLDRSGRLVWSTYLGGPTRDSGWGIDVDSRRDVYVSGSSIGGFPVTAAAAQGTFGGVRDWFVAKLDGSGASLDWATYLGGSDFDGLGPTLRVDRQGNADVAGPTVSTDFPTTADAFQPTNAGGFDLGVVQLDRDGRLLFSSYLGGSGDDDNGAANPALDNEGNFYIGGVSSSPDFPVTPNAIQPTYGGGDIDGLLVKVAFGHGH